MLLMLSVRFKPILLSVIMLNGIMLSAIMLNVVPTFIVLYSWRHDNQHNDIQHNDTQHNRLIYDTQHNSFNSMECLHAECRVFYCYADCRFAGCHVAVYLVIVVNFEHNFFNLSVLLVNYNVFKAFWTNYTAPGRAHDADYDLCDYILCVRTSLK